MRDRIVPICLVFPALVAGCQDPSGEAMPSGEPVGEETSPAVHTSPPEEVHTSPPEEGEGGQDAGAISRLAVWTASGDVAVIDAVTGAILSQAAGGGLGGDADVTWDPWKNRLITFEGDPEGQWGEVATYALGGAGGGGLGGRKHEVWIDGVARVMPSPFGAVVMEESYGPRWRLVSPDGPTPSVAAPLPRSIALGPAGQGAVRIEALTYGFEDASLEMWSADVTAEGVQPPSVFPVDDFASPETPTRWAESTEGAYLATAISGDVWLSAIPLDGPPVILTMIAAGVDRVEAMVALPGATLAMLVSGDTDLVLARLSPPGDLDCAVTLDLPGEARTARSFFSRDLLVAGPDRLLVATSTGVFSIMLSDGCPFSATIDPGFDGDALRGPITAEATPF